jgi:hypothetical protein
MWGFYKDFNYFDFLEKLKLFQELRGFFPNASVKIKKKKPMARQPLREVSQFVD